MNTKAAHTPTPWHIEMEDERGVYISTPETDFMIATLECEPPDDVTRCNARMIVTAVNHHQELITRLYNLKNTIDIMRGNTNGECPGAVSVAAWRDLEVYAHDAEETLKKVIQ